MNVARLCAPELALGNRAAIFVAVARPVLLATLLALAVGADGAVLDDFRAGVAATASFPRHKQPVGRIDLAGNGLGVDSRPVPGRPWGRRRRWGHRCPRWRVRACCRCLGRQLWSCWCPARDRRTPARGHRRTGWRHRAGLGRPRDSDACGRQRRGWRGRPG